MKKCTKCNQIKPFESFSKRKASKDGLQYKCKICDKKISAEWLLNNYEHMRKLNANWYAKNAEHDRNKTNTKITLKTLNVLFFNCLYFIVFHCIESLRNYLKYDFSSALAHIIFKFKLIFTAILISL